MLHLIISSQDKPLEDIMRDMKRHTSKEITKAIMANTKESRRDWMLWFFKRDGEYNPNNDYYQFWQQGNHPIELWSEDVTRQKLDYLHNNPVVAGWVDEPEDFLYSSARDYAGRKGLIEISLLF